MSPTTRPADAPADGEFGLIARYFQRPGHPTPAQVALGIGDDCALLVPTPGCQMAISSDMLVEGRHFFPDVDPHALGHKALAVNLSDLAAMGATPKGFTLALALPSAEDAWLSAFASGLFTLADAHQCTLIGGDTTRGPLNICITVFGEVDPAAALRRHAARPGDDIYVSGSLGQARLALEIRRRTAWACAITPESEHSALMQRLDRPEPRVPLGRALGGVAHAALDLSDGLVGDLTHILQASGVGAELDWDSLPRAGAIDRLPEAHQQTCLLHGGDDYELLFTAPASERQAVEHAARVSMTPVHRIGRITEETRRLRLIDAHGSQRAIEGRGYDHFA
jgi:thiamine-monophosphate kinase